MHFPVSTFDFLAPLVPVAIAFASALWAWRSWRAASRKATIGERSLHISANQYASQLLIGFHQILIQHPGLSPYLYDIKDCQPGESKSEQVEALCAYRLDLMEAIWDHAIEYEDVDRNAWREWMHDAFQKSHMLRERYARAPRWYPSVRAMLTGAICRDPEHGWAREHALEKVWQASRALATAHAQLREHCPEIGVNGVTGGSPGKPLAALSAKKKRHLRQQLNDVALQQKILGMSDHPVKLAAGWPWPEKGRIPGKRMLIRLTAGSVARLPGSLFWPELHSELRDFLRNAPDPREVDEGRNMGLAEAIQYAVESNELQ